MHRRVAMGCEIRNWVEKKPGAELVHNWAHSNSSALLWTALLSQAIFSTCLLSTAVMSVARSSSSLLSALELGPRGDTHASLVQLHATQVSVRGIRIRIRLLFHRR